VFHTTDRSAGTRSAYWGEILYHVGVFAVSDVSETRLIDEGIQMTAVPH